MSVSIEQGLINVPSLIHFFSDETPRHHSTEKIIKEFGRCLKLTYKLLALSTR